MGRSHLEGLTAKWVGRSRGSGGARLEGAEPNDGDAAGAGLVADGWGFARVGIQDPE